MRIGTLGSTGARISAALATTVILAVAASCGDSGVELSEAGARGKRIASASGCAGCHGADGQGGVGPSWQGLAGATVTLRDGSTVVADDEYLTRSIADPDADLLADYTLQMPRNRLDDSEIADVVAFIKDLRDVGG